ncbi:Mo-dependent nitrogenase C-terminal domain-containing protein [Calothrix rhizosoleniae]|uniref:Mo-dependent nitrogenase C-terminal domain-containing protein n=1 Tax=Calothrix rhizosoleniae TaxID=888997 RepID=UPI000B49A335|nr:Mo-dependent nitrogenase C-terminal domain-containing protein [Calothrix rhizosoleniae]
MISTQYQKISFSPVLNPAQQEEQVNKKQQFKLPTIDILAPLQQWLDSLEIQNRKSAKVIAKLIPAQCPFERNIVVFGHKIAQIPPMCKLNPLYEQLVGLRFRALCYLVDQCGEDIQSYC